MLLLLNAALKYWMVCRFLRFVFAWLPKIGVQPKLKQFGMVVKVRRETLAFNAGLTCITHVV